MIPSLEQFARNIAAVGALFALSAAASAAEAVGLRSLQGWSAVFGDCEATFTYRIEAPDGFSGVAGWSLAVDRRTLARGETAVHAPAGQQAELTVPLRIPPVREGVVLDAELTVSCFGKDAREPAVTHRKAIHIYPRNPFADRAQWLKQRSIALYDPQGKTSQVFDRVGIPHKKLGGAAALEEIDRGLVVIGEGVSLSEHPSLADALFRLAVFATVPF